MLCAAAGQRVVRRQAGGVRAHDALQRVALGDAAEASGRNLIFDGDLVEMKAIRHAWLSDENVGAKIEQSCHAIVGVEGVVHADGRTGKTFFDGAPQENAADRTVTDVTPARDRVLNGLYHSWDCCCGTARIVAQALQLFRDAVNKRIT